MKIMNEIHVCVRILKMFHVRIIFGQNGWSSMALAVCSFRVKVNGPLEKLLDNRPDIP